MEFNLGHLSEVDILFEGNELLDAGQERTVVPIVVVPLTAPLTPVLVVGEIGVEILAGFEDREVVSTLFYGVLWDNKTIPTKI